MDPNSRINDIVNARYRILKALGQGGSGITYAAEVLATGQRVALKELSLRGLADWKKIELFEREARTLETLTHPAIPAYIDYFQVDTADNRWFYLVQELAEGTSLFDRVNAGWRVDEAEARRIARAILVVLTYLHALNPPVIHRDIKPQNIILREDGHLYLVDFGAVQTVYRDSLRAGSTVVGTYGYMAPEQFRGQAVPTTDLYGLGATLLFLLTHQDPADLPQERLRITFRPYLSVSPSFADWLDRLIDPLVEDRFPSAQAALDTLDHPVNSLVSAPEDQSLIPRQPAGTRVLLEKTRHELNLDIPPVGFRGETVALGLFSLFWNGFLVVWTLGAAVGGGGFFALFSIPFWLIGGGMVIGVVNNILKRVHLHIGPHQFVLEQSLLGRTRRIEGKTADLSGVELQTAYTSNNRPIHVINLIEGVHNHKWGTPLSEVEKNWLVAEINDFLQQQRSR